MTLLLESPALITPAPVSPAPTPSLLEDSSLVWSLASTRSQLGVLRGSALSGSRWCGSGRIQGGVYLESALSGCDLTPFLIDPPEEVDPAQFGLSSQGMSRFQDEDGSVHFIDRVGVSHYPSVQDFLFEAANMGLSRRIPKNADFRGLDSRSTLILLHDKALITNPQDFAHLALQCPLSRHRAGESCLDLHRFLAPDGEGTRGGGGQSYKLEGTQHTGASYAPAFFLRVPITTICVVTGADSALTMEALRAVGHHPVECSE